MPVRRWTLLVAVLTGLFAAGVALAIAGLLALGDPGIALVCLVAAAAGVAAAVLAWFVVRALAEEAEDAGPVKTATPGRAAPAARPRPLRIQSLPVADLPAPYVAAVMNALHADRAAMQRRSGSHERASR